MDDERRAIAPRLGRGPDIALAAVTAYARDAAAGRGAVVLVEGLSDRAAVEALAARRGRDLRADGVFTVPMGGATNLGHFLDLLGPRGRGVRLAGLCDAAEAPGFRRAMLRAGLTAARPTTARSTAARPAVARPTTARPAVARPPAASLSLADFLDRLGFFVCVEDLEDELIRSLGTDRVEQVVADQGELGPLRTFSKQPAQRERTREQQLRRFMGTRSGRKIQYARALAEALDPASVPDPLARLLAYV
ncbi:MAG TPA: TOPRIM nucleotidyl transferase/hydrolase domain-containing protein [Streptosporangiaceae bacterium]|nr:TOPRIM nucleotidyl transferase/hydrolase domain-containing protein [Streptosporangiaceae bacterium]